MSYHCTIGDQDITYNIFGIGRERKIALENQQAVYLPGFKGDRRPGGLMVLSDCCLR